MEVLIDIIFDLVNAAFAVFPPQLFQVVAALRHEVRVQPFQLLQAQIQVMPGQDRFQRNQCPFIPVKLFDQIHYVRHALVNIHLNRFRSESLRAEFIEQLIDGHLKLIDPVLLQLVEKLIEERAVRLDEDQFPIPNIFIVNDLRIIVHIFVEQGVLRRSIGFMQFRQLIDGLADVDEHSVVEHPGQLVMQLLDELDDVPFITGQQNIRHHQSETAPVFMHINCVEVGQQFPDGFLRLLFEIMRRKGNRRIHPRMDIV